MFIVQRVSSISIYSSPLTLLKCMEDTSTRETARFNTTANALIVHFLHTSTVDVQHLEAWCVKPDVLERDRSKLASPSGGNAHTTEYGWKLVTKAFPAVETRIWQFPYAVNTVCAFWFGKNIFKHALEKRKENDLLQLSLFLFYLENVELIKSTGIDKTICRICNKQVKKEINRCN